MSTNRSFSKLAVAAMAIAVVLILPASAYPETLLYQDSLCPWRGGNSYRCYAHVWRSPGSYSGVHGTIEVANPVLRESNATSGAQMAIVNYAGQWFELGWTKQASYYGCDPWLYWAKEPGTPNFLQYVPPGYAYRLSISVIHDDFAWWQVKVIDNQTNQQLHRVGPLATFPSWNRGYLLQANGEVGPSSINDMGVSGLLNLKYRTYPGSGWYAWFGAQGIEDPPRGIYHAVKLGAENDWQVYGGQGLPGFYCQ